MTKMISNSPTRARASRSGGGALVGAILLLFALDFRRADSGGSMAQIVLYVAIIGVFVALLYTSALARHLVCSRPLLCCIAYVAYVAFVAKINDVPDVTWLLGWAPYVTFLIGIGCGGFICYRPDQSVFFSKVLLVASIIGLVFRYAYARSALGLEVDELRWQASSAFAAVAITLCAYQFLGTKRPLLLAYPAVLCWLYSSYIQITRVTIFFGLMACGICALVLFWKGDSAAKILAVRRLVVGVALVIVVVVGFAALNPVSMERWEQRLFRDKSVSGRTITAVTREHERSGFVEGLGSSVRLWFTGTGVGSMHYHSAALLEEGFVNSTDLMVGTTHPVHSTLYNSIKTGGLIGAGVVFLGFVFATLRGVRLLFFGFRPDTSVYQVLAIGFLCSLPTLLHGDPFFNRDGAFVFGLMSGACFYGVKTLRPVNSLRNLKRSF